MPLGIKLTLRAIECQVLGSLGCEFAVFHALAKSGAITSSDSQGKGERGCD